MVELNRQRLGQARRAVFEDYRRRNAAVWLGPRGSSMRPLVGPNTWLYVEFGAADVSVGDIIVFPLGDIIVAHRVVSQRTRQGETLLIPKGDAEPYPDPPIQPASVLGVVRALRQGRDGPGSRFGCAGVSARLAARLSRWLGYAAVGARRMASFLPDPLRRVVLVAIPPCIRVVARTLLAPLPWATWLDRSKQENGRR